MYLKQVMDDVFPAQSMTIQKILITQYYVTDFLRIYK